MSNQEPWLPPHPVEGPEPTEEEIQQIREDARWRVYGDVRILAEALETEAIYPEGKYLPAHELEVVEERLRFLGKLLLNEQYDEFGLLYGRMVRGYLEGYVDSEVEQ